MLKSQNKYSKIFRGLTTAKSATRELRKKINYSHGAINHALRSIKNGKT